MELFKKFIILYGLPGCGKTSVCKELLKEVNGLTYIDIGGHTDFNKLSVIDIIREQFNYDTDVIVEGCFKNFNFRNALRKEFSKTHKGYCIYIHESLENLEKRRNRNKTEYWKLLKDMQLMYLPPTHTIIDKPTIKERVSSLKKILYE